MFFPTKSLRFAAVAFALAASLFAAQRPRMNPQARVYNPSTEVSLQGTVENVTNPSAGAMMGTHLSIKTEDEVVTVALGPAAFVSSQGFAFATGDKVKITGSKVTLNGKPWVIAREVEKDGKTLTLRAPDGTPKWSRGMMGKSSGGSD